MQTTAIRTIIPLFGRGTYYCDLPESYWAILNNGSYIGGFYSASVRDFNSAINKCCDSNNQYLFQTPEQYGSVFSLCNTIRAWPTDAISVSIILRITSGNF